MGNDDSNEILETIAEVRKVEAKKLVCNEMQYLLTVVTNDSKILSLGALPSDKLIKIKIYAS